MLSPAERNKLLQAMGDERAAGRAAIARCAAGLVVIVLIAVAGVVVPINITSSASKPAALTAAADPHGYSRAQQHRKQIFDERRARFEGDAGRRSVASGSLRPAEERLPVLLQ